MRAFIGPQFPLLVLCFDDGRVGDYVNTFPAMTERGFLGTSYVNGAIVNAGSDLTWQQARDMQDAGWDIQCHGFTDQTRTSMSEQELHSDYQNQDSIFIANGIKKPIIHQFPQGLHNPLALSVASEYRKALWNTSEGINKYPSVSEVDGVYHIKRYGGMDMYTQQIADSYKRLVNQAVTQRNVVLSIVLHEVTNVLADANQYRSYLGYFEDFLDYVATKDIKVVTAKKAYELIKQYKTVSS